MANVIVTITTASIDKPTTKTGGNWQVRLFRAGFDPVVSTSESLTHTFPSISAGTATIRAVRLATDGSLLGTEITSVIEVPASVPGAEQVEVVGALVITYS